MLYMSPKYDEHRSMMYEPPEVDLGNKNSSHTLLIELAGHGRDILEIGTSTGYISKILAQRGNSVTGIEIDPEAAEIARQYCCRMIVSDVEALDIHDISSPDSFDVIMLGDVLEHLVSPEVLLRKIRPLLRSDGYLAISLPNVCHGDVLLKLLHGDFQYTPMGLLDVTHLRFFGLRNIFDLMCRSGYTITEVKTIHHDIGTTELRIDQNSVPTDLIRFICSLPHSDVYQYIIIARPFRPWDRVDPVPSPDLNHLFSSAIQETISREKRDLFEEIEMYKQESAHLHQQVQEEKEKYGRILAESLDLKKNLALQDARALEYHDSIQGYSTQLTALSHELESVKQSLVWRTLMAFHYGFVEKAFPHDSRRRRWYELGIHGTRVIANEGLRSFFTKTSYYLRSRGRQPVLSESHSSPEEGRFSRNKKRCSDPTLFPYIRGRGIGIGSDPASLCIPGNVRLNVIDSNRCDDLFQTRTEDFCIIMHALDQIKRDQVQNLFSTVRTGGMMLVLDHKDSSSSLLDLLSSIPESRYSLVRREDVVLRTSRDEGEGCVSCLYVLEKIDYIDRIVEFLKNEPVQGDQFLIDIIIPVYNAYDDLLRCLYSVVHHQQGYRIILINDCSTDERIADLFSVLENIGSQRLVLLRNEENLGFVGTVNRGMRFSKQDVILLNSDTIVTAGWALKMHHCAGLRPDVATVTPFTNNGTICSIPDFCQENDLPAGFTVDSFGRFIEKVSLRRYPCIPTAVGFCMYIKRDLLETIGYFNEEAFGKGYGEENDFCMRAKNQGFIHLLCDDTFVFHKGEASFSEKKAALIRENTATLQAMYPEYLPTVHSFIHNNPLKELHATIHSRMAVWDQFGEAKRILYLLHTWGGGTEKHLRDLIHALSDMFVFYVLQVTDERLLLFEIHRGFETEYSYPLSSPIGAYQFHHDEYEQILSEIIDRFEIDLIHVHHLIGHSFDVATVSHARGIPLLITVHDFYAVCPNINLLDCNLRLCMDEVYSAKCDLCLNLSKGLPAGFVSQWRAYFTHLFECCSCIIFPSDSAASILMRYYPDIRNNSIVIEHGSDDMLIEEDIPATTSGNGLLHIGYIGGLGPNKGREIFYSLASSKELFGRVKWSIFGVTDLHNQPGYYPEYNLTIHGQYKDFDELRRLVWEEGVDLIIFPAVWPETFSYTLSEAWALGLPVLVSGLGALKNRVERHGGGWVVSSCDLKGFLQVIEEIVASPEMIDQKKQEVSGIALRSVEDMAEEYTALYRRIVGVKRM